MMFGNKIVLVTGGSRGIGREISTKFAELGATVLINYLKNTAAAEETQKALRESGADCRLYQANLNHSQEITGLASKISEDFGRLDVLVHNAALGVFKPTLELRANQWDLSMNINARALLLLAKNCLGLMKEGGRIIAISSLGSRIVTPNYGARGISKAALETLVRYLAVEMAERGIRVNAVSGGVIESDSTKKFPEHEKLLSSVQERIPAKRVGQPEDIANAVIFLASDKSSWIYGHLLVVDGGLSL